MEKEKVVEVGSWMRKHLTYFFWAIAIPTSWCILVVITVIVLRDGELKASLANFLLVLFVLTHSFWAVPKVFQKVVEGIFNLKQ